MGFRRSMLLTADSVPPDNEIWYTSTDGNIITPSNMTPVSNTYSGGKGVMVFSSAVTNIASSAFASKTTLQTVKLPKTCTVLNENAFSTCSNLETAYLPNVTTLQGSVEFTGYNGVFRKCTKLKSVVGHRLTSLNYAVFYDCSSLEDIDLSSCTFFYGSCFRNCTSLKKVNLRSFLSTPTVQVDAYGIFLGCTSLEVVEEFHASRVEYGMFEGCTSLRSIDLSHVTEIWGSAFIGCTSLTGAINLPLLTTTGSNTTDPSLAMFAGCTGITSVNMPNIETIWDGMFYNCTSLTRVTINRTTPPTLANANAFTNTNNCPIYVPSEAVETYKAATNWSSLADRIFAIPSE